MRTLVIDMSDFGGEASEGDKVRLYAPRVRGSAYDPSRIITPADRTVTLDVGRAEVANVEPGPLAVQLKPKGGLRAGTSFETAVPEGDGPVTLRSCLESNFQYEPPIVSAVQQAAQDVSEWHDRTVEAADRVGSAEQVGVWAESAESSASAAGSSASDASQSASAASGSASAADGSAQAAAESASKAASSEEAAEGWAGQSKDAAVLSITSAAALERHVADRDPTADDHAYKGAIWVAPTQVWVRGEGAWYPVTANEHYEIIVDADYTGQSDARPAIQAAIDQGHAENRPVRLKPGTLRVDAALVPRDGTILRGAGMGKTIIRPQGTANAIEYTVELEDDPIEDVIFTDFDVDAADQVLPTTGYTATRTKGIFIEKMRRIEMRNLHIKNTGATGLGIDHVSGVIENVWATNCGRLNDGTGLGGSGIGIGTGWLDQDFEPLTIAHCHTEGNGRFGIFLESQTHYRWPSGITITGCTARGNKDGIGDAGSTGTIIIGNHVYENSRSGIAVDHGTMSTGHPGISSKVTDNYVSGNAAGILVFAGPNGAVDGVQITDNTVRDNSGVGVSVLIKTSDYTLQNRNLKLAGNDVHGNAGGGIIIDAGAWNTNLVVENFWISNNRVWENATTGLSLYANSVGSVIDGNQAWDNQTAPTQTTAVSATGTHEGMVASANHWRSGTVTLPVAEGDVVDSGVRNIVTLMSDYTTSTFGLNLLRVGNSVQCSLNSREMDVKAITSGDTLFTLPVGFRPAMGYRVTTVQPEIGLEITSAGAVIARGSVPQAAYFTFTVTHPTQDPAATILPGNPA